MRLQQKSLTASVMIETLPSVSESAKPKKQAAQWRKRYAAARRRRTRLLDAISTLERAEATERSREREAWEQIRCDTNGGK